MSTSESVNMMAGKSVPPAPPRSQSTSVPPPPPPAAGVGDAPPPGPFVRQAREGPAQRFGKIKNDYNARLFPGVDVIGGLGAMNPDNAEVVPDSRMGVDDAGSVNARILEAWGISRESDADIMTVMDGVFHNATVNGMSTAMPGRGYVTLRGTRFYMADIVSILNEDLRRWGRAHADALRATNRRTIARNGLSEEATQRYEDLMRVARKRGIHRYPHLAHDTADYCSGLSIAEFMAVEESRRHVTANSANYVDTVMPSGRTVPADGFVGNGYSSVAAGRSAPGRRES